MTKAIAEKINIKIELPSSHPYQWFSDPSEHRGLKRTS